MTTLRGYKINLDPAQIADIKTTYARGVPVAVIAKTYGVSTSTVYAHVSGSRRVPCPRCGVPMAVTSNTCRKCSDTRAAAAAARSGWAQQAPRRSAGEMDGSSPQGAPPAPLGLTKKVSWQCPTAPTGAHHWVLDLECLGRCDHCHETRQFSRQVSNPAG